MGDFADGFVDEIGGFGEFLLVGVRIGDAGFVGGVEDFDNQLFGKASALAIGAFGVHGGKIEDGKEPSDDDNKRDDYENDFTFGSFHMQAFRWSRSHSRWGIN